MKNATTLGPFSSYSCLPSPKRMLQNMQLVPDSALATGAFLGPETEWSHLTPFGLHAIARYAHCAVRAGSALKYPRLGWSVAWIPLWQ